MAGLDVDLAFLLNQSSYALAARLGGELSRLGISFRDFCVLMKADETERTQNAVAELAMLDKTTMVSTLDRLEQAGLAERRVSSTDRRARVIAVTPKGKRVLTKAYEVTNGAIDGSLSVLAPKEREIFLQALTKLVEGPLATPSHTRPVRRKNVRAVQADQS
jgi:DNA-binding MarR family transcriptional regulator